MKRSGHDRTSRGRRARAAGRGGVRAGAAAQVDRHGRRRRRTGRSTGCASPPWTAARCAPRRGTACCPSTTPRSCAPPTPCHPRHLQRVGDGTRRARARPRCRAGRRLDARLVSICTGAFVLAAAGRLDDRPATTHWMHAGAFRHPVPAGQAGSRTCCTSTTATCSPPRATPRASTCCLHIVRRDHGPAVANRVARRSVVAPWREGGQSQFMEPVPDPDGPGTPATRAWALDRLARATHPRRPRRTLHHERAHVHPPLPRGDRA